VQHISKFIRPTAVQLGGLYKTSTADTTEQLSCNEVDELLDAVSDLVNPSFREWYCKAFYKLGPQTVHALAKQSRKGKNPARYFSFLLRHAMKDTQRA
jgi:hypothetical protein